jgi:hypothetical protein
MPERDPDRLLAAYRSGLGPSRAAEDRMLASLHSQILVLPDPSGGAGAGGGAGASGGLGATVTAKLAAVALSASIGVAAVTVAVIGRDAPAPAPARVVSVEPAPVVVEVAPPPTSPPVQEEPSYAEPVEPEVLLAPETPQPRSTTRRRARKDEPEPAPKLADEAKLLRGVDVALRQGDLAGAHEQLDAYHGMVATGSLRAQADELELLLSCAEKLDGASKRALDHLDAHPESRARTRIEAACGLR